MGILFYILPYKYNIDLYPQFTEHDFQVGMVNINGFIDVRAYDEENKYSVIETTNKDLIILGSVHDTIKRIYPQYDKANKI